MARTLYYIGRSAIDHYVDRLLDWVHGIDTSGEVGYAEMRVGVRDWKQGSLYRPARWTCLWEGLRGFDVTPRDVFVDYGCGKGRVLFLASRRPFGRVIGVDFSEPLVETARLNLARIRNRAKCKDLEVVNTDAREWQVPDSMTVAFFYNPFQGELWEHVFRNLQDSLERVPRTIRIIYLRPLMHDFLLEHGFHEIRRTRPIKFLYYLDLAIYENTGGELC